MQKQDYNEFNTRVSWYNEEMDDLLSRISNNFVFDVNENGVESAILEECQRTENFDLNSDSVEISSTFLSAKDVSNPYVEGLRSGYLDVDCVRNLISIEKENIEESRSFQEQLRNKESDELIVRQLKMQDWAKWKGKEKECDDKSFDNNKSMGSKSRSTIHISSSSTKYYHLERSAGENEEELLMVLKPKFLQATKLTEKEKNRDVEEDECVILNSNPFHPNNIDIHPMMSLSYNDPSRLQDEDVTVISERGQVACRDYPHSRHHCGTFPFDKTSHYACCRQCYCFVCDLVAPCKYWNGNSGHCHASDHDPKWKDMKAFQRGLKKR